MTAILIVLSLTLVALIIKVTMQTSEIKDLQRQIDGMDNTIHALASYSRDLGLAIQELQQQEQYPSGVPGIQFMGPMGEA